MKENTKFAPAFRSSKEEIADDHELIILQKLFNEIFRAIKGTYAIIDNNRQIIYANSDFLTFLGLKTIDQILGMRPGETMSCIHASEESAGCGTSVSCAYCGAVNSILESQATGLKTIKETRITSSVEGLLKSWDLKITTSPLTLDGKQFYMVTFEDISNEKRRSQIERIFFHDLLNTAGGLNGLLSILKEGADPVEERELISMSEEASRDIIEEILLHRQILAAENGDLKVKIEMVNSMQVIESAIARMGFHESGKNRHLIIEDNTENIIFETDRLLIQRIIINLLKNALEATNISGSVTTHAESNGDKIKFRVKNSGVIPQDVQLQLFQRSFSTKGPGRGIGTYSIRLLTENYLKGTVSFVSNETEGTVFTVELNKVFPNDSAG